MPRLSIEERFWKKVDKSAGPDGCWIWTASRTKGYGKIKKGGKLKLAHQLAWELANSNPMPANLVVLHDCDNPSCVNPAHLTVGTQTDNVRDCVKKGRTCSGETNPKAKLTEDQVKQIRATYDKAAGRTLAYLAKVYQVGHVTIWNAIHRVNWKSVL
jgi:hypothetical protein